MEPDRLRDALAHHPAAVVVVSTTYEGGYRGLTATSFSSVSLDPPLVLVCLDAMAITREAVIAAGAFNVSVLSRRQEFLAERFSGLAPVVDPAWREVPHRVLENGMPIIEGCVGWFQCAIREVHDGGDHDIVVASVLDAGREPGEPLVYWDRGFWRLTTH